MHPFRPRSKALTLLAGLALSALVGTACGGGDDLRKLSASEADGPDGSGPIDIGGSGGDCPDRAAVTEAVDQATYAVYVQWPQGYDDEGDPLFYTFFTGTAWAVGEHHLVTNAHVAMVAFDYPQARIVAVQSGTKDIVTLLTAYTHPDYGKPNLKAAQNPTLSPDVGVFTTQQPIDRWLELAPTDVEINLRDDVYMTGFPGDVDSYVGPVEPGKDIPQASASTGTITALRNFRSDVEVTSDNVDVIEHDAPGSPGSSGSSLVQCGEVIGVHNAGLHVFVQSANAAGWSWERVSTSDFRYGIHVRHIDDLLELIDSGALEGADIQPKDATCPVPEDVNDEITAATYAVVAMVFAGYDNQGSPVIVPMPVGTAFAMDGHVLVTNGHITEFLRDAGMPIVDVYAVQSGTGSSFRLTRAMTHPSYNGDPLHSPDLGLLTTEQQMPRILYLARRDVALERGETLSVSGFPGDVNDIAPIIPGETRPQATVLTGSITALRSHDERNEVTTETVDVIQHQAPVTPGSSGSPMVWCGQVVGVNNAGTVKLVLVLDPSGEVVVDRQMNAANNFGVHIKHVWNLYDQFRSNALQGFSLPPEATGGQGDGGFGQSSGLAALAGTYNGEVKSEDAVHTFTFTVADDGTVTGTSSWPETGEFALSGSVGADGTIVLQDDGFERMGFRTGVYDGRIDATTGKALGAYYEVTAEDSRWQWMAWKA